MLRRPGREVSRKGSRKFSGQDMRITEESQINTYVYVCAVRFTSVGGGLQASYRGNSNLEQKGKLTGCRVCSHRFNKHQSVIIKCKE